MEALPFLRISSFLFFWFCASVDRTAIEAGCVCRGGGVSIRCTERVRYVSFRLSRSASRKSVNFTAYTLINRLIMVIDYFVINDRWIVEFVVVNVNSQLSSIGRLTSAIEKIMGHKGGSSERVQTEARF